MSDWSLLDVVISSYDSCLGEQAKNVLSLSGEQVPGSFDALPHGAWVVLSEIILNELFVFCFVFRCLDAAVQVSSFFLVVLLVLRPECCSSGLQLHSHIIIAPCVLGWGMF